MRQARVAYTETTTSPMNIVVGAIIVVALGGIAAQTRGWIAYAITAAIVAVICWQLSVVRISIGNGVLTARQGPLVSYRVPLVDIMHPEILQFTTEPGARVHHPAAAADGENVRPARDDTTVHRR